MFQRDVTGTPAESQSEIPGRHAFGHQLIGAPES
jgi:hypothetical protein